MPTTQLPREAEYYKPCHRRSPPSTTTPIDTLREMFSKPFEPGSLVPPKLPDYARPRAPRVGRHTQKPSISARYPLQSLSQTLSQESSRAFFPSIGSPPPGFEAPPVYTEVEDDTPLSRIFRDTSNGAATKLPHPSPVEMRASKRRKRSGVIISHSTATSLRDSFNAGEFPLLPSSVFEQEFDRVPISEGSKNKGAEAQFEHVEADTYIVLPVPQATASNPLRSMFEDDDDNEGHDTEDNRNEDETEEYFEKLNVESPSIGELPFERTGFTCSFREVLASV